MNPMDRTGSSLVERVYWRCSAHLAAFCQLAFRSLVLAGLGSPCLARLSNIVSNYWSSSAWCWHGDGSAYGTAGNVQAAGVQPWPCLGSRHWHLHFLPVRPFGKKRRHGQCSLCLISIDEGLAASNEPRRSRVGRCLLSYAVSTLALFASWD